MRSPAAPGRAAAAAAGAAVPVIVFLKNQPAAEGGDRDRSDQRFAVIQAAQAPYLDQLEQLGAADVHKYALVDAIAARVPSSAVATLADNPGVAAVIPDSPIVGPAAAADAPAARRAHRRLPDTCDVHRQGAPGRLLGDPAARAGRAHPHPHRLDHGRRGDRAVARLHRGGGEGRVPGRRDRPGQRQPAARRQVRDRPLRGLHGRRTAAPTEGGEAFIDANAIAGQGRQVYNVAGFGAQTPGTACNIRIQGVAPGASLVALKVFSNNDISTTSAFLQAIDYAVDTEHVNVLNESFGANPFPDVSSLDAVEEFNNMAVAAGVTVVVAAGDAGPFNTIGSPAVRPERHLGRRVDRLPVLRPDRLRRGGQVRARRLAEQQHQRALERRVHPGRTDPGPGGARRPLVRLLHARPAEYADCVNFLGKASPVEETGGTSESAPEVAGAAALVIQAYRKAHGNATPTPAQVKQILLSTATDLGAPATEQGSGLLNSLKAVELASFMSHCDPVGETLRLSSNQLNYVGKPGATAHWSVTVTNTGVKTQRCPWPDAASPATRSSSRPR